MKKPELESELRFMVSSKLLERALSASAEGITIADAQSPNRPLIYCNEGFERLTGYSRSETLGRNCRFLQGSETARDAVDEIRDAVQAGRECVVELLNYRKSGVPFWNRLSITPVRNDEGVVTHFIGVQSDVTERRNAEEALRDARDGLEKINNKMSRDLKMAARVQRSLLPETPPSIPGVHVAWAVDSCDELAGDTLGFRRLNDTELAVYVVDVSGHGVASSLLSVTLMHWFDQRLESPIGKSTKKHREVCAPVAVAESLNRNFPIDLNTGQYFTLIYGVLDSSSREFRYVCAGHPPPIHVPGSGKPTSQMLSSFPIGITPQPDYTENVIRLASGDRIFLYTDGLIEAENSKRAHYGVERVLAALFGNTGYDLDQTVKALISSVDDWSGQLSRTDDISVMAIELE